METQNTTTKKFEVGKCYIMRAINDYNCIWIYKVVGRTAKTIKIKEVTMSKVITKRLCEFRGEEICQPLGSYSMSPGLRASKVIEFR